MGEVNWEELAKGLGDQATDVLKGLAKGAAEDLQKFGKDIALDLVRCIKENRPEVEAEVKEQMKVLAEINRIKFEGAAGAFASQAIVILAKTARVALAAAGISL
jgi:hypothetical protein